MCRMGSIRDWEDLRKESAGSLGLNDHTTSGKVSNAWDEKVFVEVLHLTGSAGLCDTRVVVGQVLGRGPLYRCSHGGTVEAGFYWQMERGASDRNKTQVPFYPG